MDAGAIVVRQSDGVPARGSLEIRPSGHPAGAGLQKALAKSPYGQAATGWAGVLSSSGPGWHSRSAVDGQRGGQLLVARCEAAVALLGIAVDLRARIERMAHAAHLMLDRKQHLAGIEGDDVLKTVLVLIALLGDETPLPEAAIGSGEIGEVDGDVMTIKGRCRLGRLAEIEVLASADRDARKPPLRVLTNARPRLHDLAVETRDPVGRADARLEFHVGHAKLYAPEARARCKEPYAVAPRARRLDKLGLLADAETGAFEGPFHCIEPPQQRGAIGRHQPGVTTQHLRCPGRQMKLAAADVHPHVADAGHQVGIAGEAETRSIKEDCQLLVRHAGVHVLEGHDIADILHGAVVRAHGPPSRLASLPQRTEGMATS